MPQQLRTAAPCPEKGQLPSGAQFSSANFDTLSKLPYCYQSTRFQSRLRETTFVSRMGVKVKNSSSRGEEEIMEMKPNGAIAPPNEQNLKERNPRNIDLCVVTLKFAGDYSNKVRKVGIFTLSRQPVLFRRGGCSMDSGDPEPAPGRAMCAGKNNADYGDEAILYVSEIEDTNLGDFLETSAGLINFFGMTEQGNKRPNLHAKGDVIVAQNPPWNADFAVAIASPKYDDNPTRGAEQPLGYHSGVSEILRECKEKIRVSKEVFRLDWMQGRPNPKASAILRGGREKDSVNKCTAIVWGASEYEIGCAAVSRAEATGTVLFRSIPDFGDLSEKLKSHVPYELNEIGQVVQPLWSEDDVLGNRRELANLGPSYRTTVVKWLKLVDPVALPLVSSVVNLGP
ncbi:hypothetical protein K438DRAFT_1768271 [Mycena galopus ATCC 62051]|nr:hypothetical protein K438DRAFT_1768271 [Mycena galopus ATCC 62051]